MDKKYMADYPARQKAIKIMEYISEEVLEQEEIFDGARWYDIEDKLTTIIEGEENA